MTAQQIKQTILNKMAQADALAFSLKFGTAPADAADKIETLSDEIEALSDTLAEI